VQGSQSMVRSLRVQSQQLPTESQVFRDEVLAGTASAEVKRQNGAWSLVPDDSSAASRPDAAACGCMTGNHP
jgi:hypothetical protein